MVYYENAGFSAFVASNHRSFYIGSVTNSTVGGYPTLVFFALWFGLSYGGIVSLGMKRNPSVGIVAEATTRARLLGAELGCSPVSRSRPSIRDEGDDDLLDCN